MISLARIVRATDDDAIDDLAAIDRTLLPDAPKAPDDTDWWAAFIGAEIVGYAAGRAPLAWPGYYYLSRVGVLEHARGQGLQKRFVRARLRRARKIGCHTTLTYTSTDNAPSMRSLIACGFRPYDPEEGCDYVGTDFVYWKIRL